MRIFISALEPSANIHLRELGKHLNELARANGEKIELLGIFDSSVFENLQYVDVKSSYELSAFATMGFVDVLKRIFFYKRVNEEMVYLANTCDKALLIDSSSFHIPLAKGLKKLRKNNKKPEIIYYILPQVWAWKPWRAKTIEKICDRICATLPFELSLYPNALKNGKAEFVGHPLLDSLPLKSLKTRGENIVFMPGSRKSEIKRIFPLFIELSQKMNDSPKVLVLPIHFAKLSKQELYKIYGQEIENFSVSFDAIFHLQSCKFAFICSGTATLQAALLGAPFCLAYTMRKVEFYLIRAFVHLNVVGLANILYQAALGQTAGKGEARLHSEYIQDDLNVENLLEGYEKFDYETYAKESKKLREYLKQGSSERIAQILMQSL